MRQSPLMILSAVLIVGVLAGCAPTGFKIEPVPVDRTLEEEVLIDDGGLRLPKILVVDVDGVILNSRGASLFGEKEHPVSLFVEKLEKAAKDKRVRAVILRINSPGGSVTASDLMYSELLYFKQRTHGERPVVAVLMDVAASGGYYLACGADEIVAHRTTITGSIGVIMQTINFSGTMTKIGITSDAITSGKMKDAGSPLRKMKPEEREIFQGLVNQFYGRFVEVVAAGRSKLDKAKVRELADGRVYSAQHAMELGFVDRIGTLRTAVAGVKEQIDVAKVRVITYKRPLGWKPNLYAQAPAQPPQTNLINIELPESWPHPTPQFMYLWAPGW